MNNLEDLCQSLLGTWQTNNGIIITLEDLSCHVFNGQIQIIGSNTFPHLKRRISGLIYSDSLTITLLSFFCNIPKPVQSQHRYAFTCEFIYKESSNMNMHWIEYNSYNLNKIISSGNATLKHENRVNGKHKTQNKLILN